MLAREVSLSNASCGARPREKGSRCEFIDGLKLHVDAASCGESYVYVRKV